MAVVKELNEQGKTIILIEHNMEELSLYADHVMVLESGRLVKEGAMIQVLADVEMLDDLDIYPPEVTQLFIELKKRGLSIDKIPVRYEDAERILADVINNARGVG
jgi:energy-coupling factor transport system ATP-binding protein